MQTFHITRILAIACALVSQTGGCNAQQEPFGIKGWTIGQSSEVACRGAPTTNLQDIVRETGIKDIEVPVVSCVVNVDSIAGIAVAEPARLLFWRDGLTRVSMDLGWLELEALAALRGTLLEAYGKPVTRRSDPFITDKWAKDSIQVELERTGKLPSNVGIYLTGNRGWAEYQRVKKLVDDRLDALKKLSRKRDLKE
ncbi:hypothetical protein [Limnohabitans sp. B9-3]|uniref:hypothetical protein n=1 Tax=Limnohabitans sp. B9-3 TaxID=1100707 RepID=UPI000C1F5E96|nr:hypothetical protein [Limnohabitans sp. B9-3]PIT71238.1 hypothetical protein B9Z42_15995 [Limnohabitans sp. B9-3]